jgi:endogenous inhibitor of DNA gyrase (YacG/DUF329 family)
MRCSCTSAPTCAVGTTYSWPYRPRCSARFRSFPLFRWARAEVARLVELIADDAAARHCPRRAVASALVSLAGAGVPAAALGAGGPTVLARVNRMLTPAQPLGRLRVLAAGTSVALLLTIPVVLAAAPAVGALVMDYCPLPLPA